MLSALQRLNRPVVALVAVGIIAAVLRLWHVTYPEKRIFDEYYYTKSACIYLDYSNARCDINSSDERYWRREQDDTGAWVHPPLGKWAIAAGELAFGTESFGWRFSSVVFGTASVVMLAGIAQVLFRRPVWTFTAGLLLATESLNFVQSRTSMLDIFVATWIVAGFLFLVLDRRWIDRRTSTAAAERAPAAGAGAEGVGAGAPAAGAGAEGVGAGAPAAGAGAEGAPEPPVSLAEARAFDGEGAAASRGYASGALAPSAGPLAFPQPLWRPWRLASGIAFGCAIATKWSGLTGIATAILLSVMWETTRRRRAGIRHAFWRTLQAEGFGLIAFLLVVPAIVYVASYAEWFVQHGWNAVEWLRLQRSIEEYHANLKVLDSSGKPIHPYLSEAWKWLLLWRPVLYYASYPVSGMRKVIYANGNPAVFWGGLVAVPYALVRWRRLRDWRAGFVAIAVLGLYVPWLFVSRPQFFFYATPISPFLVLACVYALQDLSEMHLAGSRSRAYLPFVVGFVVVSVFLFFWFWPALTGGPLSDAAFRLRNWFPTWT